MKPAASEEKTTPAAAREGFENVTAHRVSFVNLESK
jgi:hypothetical protein